MVNPFSVTVMETLLLERLVDKGGQQFSIDITNKVCLSLVLVSIFTVGRMFYRIVVSILLWFVMRMTQLIQEIIIFYNTSLKLRPLSFRFIFSLKVIYLVF